MQLHPLVVDEALAAYREAVRITPNRVHPFITETLRSFERSNELYAQGRTKPGKIVTNAPAGASYHNYGLAIDFTIQVTNEKGDKAFRWVVDENWMKVVQCFKEQGFAWGGDFKSIKDYPHFEMTFGYTWRQLMQKHNDKDLLPNSKYLRI